MKIKRKMLIASFFAALMLILPFTSVAEQEYIENFEMEREEEENFLDYSVKDYQNSILNILYTDAKYELKAFVEELLNLFENEGYSEYNSEVLKEVVVNLFESEEELDSTTGLMETTSGNSGTGSTTGSGVGTCGEGGDSGSTSVTETTSGGISSTGGDNNMVNAESEEVNAEPYYEETIDDIIIEIAGEQFDENEADPLWDRLGWVGKVIELRDTHKVLWAEFKDSIWPNITYVEVIEDTLAYLDIDFSVHDWIFNDLNQSLRTLAENREFLVEGLGIRQYIWENYILPALLDWGIQFILESLWEKMNSPVGKLKERWGTIKSSLKTFIWSFFSVEKAGGVAPFKAWRTFRKARRRFLICLGLFIFYKLDPMLDENGNLVINKTALGEYLTGIYVALENWRNAFMNYISYAASKPYLEPVNIRGYVTEHNPLDGLWIYCEKDPGKGRITNSDGYFEDLIYVTADEASPWRLHTCVTTSVNNDTGESQTVGNSGNKIYDLILTGAFSDGRLNLTIDFSAGDNNEYVQSQNNIIAAQKQQWSVEATTQENTQYQYISLNKHIKFLFFLIFYF